MTRPPPRSTLFPYTPLSRSLYREAARRCSDATQGRKDRHHTSSGRCGRQSSLQPTARPDHDGHRVFIMIWSRSWLRSEEHTSELQSRLHLVCRLLLEKKKTK